MTEEHFPAFRSGVLSTVVSASGVGAHVRGNITVHDDAMTVLGPQTPRRTGSELVNRDNRDVSESMQHHPCNLMGFWFSSNRFHEYFWLCDRTFSRSCMAISVISQCVIVRAILCHI